MKMGRQNGANEEMLFQKSIIVPVMSVPEPIKLVSSVSVVPDSPKRIVNYRLSFP